MEITFDLQLFGGGGGGTTVNNTSTYTPSAYELQLQKQQADYAKAIAPNSLWLNDTARNILQNSIGAVQVDFNRMNNSAQQQIDRATSGMEGLTGSNTSAANSANSKLSSLANGNLPTAYQQNMENAIATALRNTMGNTINNLGQRGVINSSVTNSAMNDISKNAADTVAQQYQQNINQAGNLTQQQYQNTLGANSANGAVYSNLINSATSPITTGAAAQEAAQQPALNLWNASLGLNNSTTGALAAAAGKGTTTSTQTQTNSGGGGLISGLLGGLF
jgi:hypothetical protein